MPCYSFVAVYTMQQYWDMYTCTSSGRCCFDHSSRPHACCSRFMQLQETRYTDCMTLHNGCIG